MDVTTFAALGGKARWAKLREKMTPEALSKMMKKVGRKNKPWAKMTPAEKKAVLDRLRKGREAAKAS